METSSSTLEKLKETPILPSPPSPSIPLPNPSIVSIMEEELSVNTSHAFSLCQYLTYTRTERESRIETINSVFTQESKKLKEAHYTKEEVIQLFNTISNLIDIEMNKELININHNTFLLLRQLLRQAEATGNTLKMNLSEIQNIELLKAVAQFEKDLYEKKAERTATILKDPSLLDDSIKNLSSDFISEFYRNDLINLSDALHKSSLDHSTSVNAMRQRMEATESKLSQEERIRNEEQKRIANMEKQHLEMTEKIRKVTEQLALKEAELEKKFQSTNTYINMQKILLSKNAQIQRLRTGNKEEDDIEPTD